jgi:ribosome-associated protein
MDDTAPLALRERPSKTQRKRTMHELQRLGARLAALGDEQLARFELPEPLREALLEARRVRSREGRRRQLQYVGRLMRAVDPAPIRASLAAIDGTCAAAIAAQHRIERWRERLLADDAALAELARDCPGADLQRLRACVREARKERGAQRPPRHYRALFQLIKAALAPPSPTVAADEDRP